MGFNLKKRLPRRDLDLVETTREFSGLWELTDTSPREESLVEFVPIKIDERCLLTASSVIAVHGLKGDPFASWTAVNGP